MISSREHPGQGGRFVEQPDPHQHGAYRTDTGPDRVGGAKGQLLDCHGEQQHAHGHGTQGKQGGEGTAETVGVLEADGPGDLEQTGQQQE